jgi:DNA-binding CsgD family transcriptional regulator
MTGSAQPSMPTLVGRDIELASIRDALAAIDDGPLVIVLEGDAGIGKTVILRAAVEAARAAGRLVLTAFATEREAPLGYATLTDLLSDVADATTLRVPPRQREALDIVLLRSSRDAPIDPRLVATATSTTLTALADAGPLVVAIDDPQWVDTASFAALAFAFRRAPRTLGVIVSRRTDDIVLEADRLEAQVPGARTVRIRPRPLTVTGIHHLLEQRVGSVPRRQVLTRIVAVSGGNPFIALELGRAVVDAHAQDDGTTPLPVSATLRQLIDRRLDRLDERTLAVVIAAALADGATPALLRRLEPGIDVDAALIAAEALDLVVEDHGRIRPSHPLLTEAIVAAIPPAERRRRHRQIADLIEDPERRARHLALATVEPDAATADGLELGAVAASARGAPGVAADLFELAAERTPESEVDSIASRSVASAAAALRAGDFGRARSLAQTVLARGPRPQIAIEAIEVVADLAWVDGTVADARAMVEASLHTAPDMSTRRRLLARLVTFDITIDPGRAARIAEEALAIDAGEEDDTTTAAVLINGAFAGAAAGLGLDLTRLERGIALETANGLTMSSVPLVLFNGIDAMALARSRAEGEDEWYRDLGEEGQRAERRAQLAVAELRAGNLAVASSLADDAADRLEGLGVAEAWPLVLGWRSLIDAHAGRIDRARTTLLPLIAATTTEGRDWWAALLGYALAVAEEAAGEPEAVIAAVAALRDRLARTRIVDLLGERSEPLAFDAALALGRMASAEAELERLQRRHDALARPWTELALARCRARWLARDGDVRAGLDVLAAGTDDAADRLPFDRAQNAVVRGRLLRRLGHKHAAASAFRDALATFDAMGAGPWAARTRGDLARVGLRRGDPSALTETETRIAELAAGGRTNREVAAEAFISPKTVEANLSRVYAKLGIRSRAELGAWLADRDRADRPQT